MKRIVLIILVAWAIGIGLAAFSFWEASANPNCGEKEQTRAKLHDDWKESVVFSGVDNRGVLLEVWANPDTGTFTVVLHTTVGIACLVAAGKDYVIMEPQSQEGDDGA